MDRTVQPPSSAVRAANRATLVDVLRRDGSATRSDLIARTGLSRATVSSLIGELQSRRLVFEQRVAAHDGFGRPPAVITLNRSAGLAIAIDVGVRHVAVAVGDLSRRVLAERWVPLAHGHSARKGVTTVLRCIDEAMAEADADTEQVVGAAISIAAPVSPDSGRLLVPGVLPGWNGAELASQVAERCGVPVVVENDANLGALAESTWGEFAGAGNLLYLKLASRVGLGIVVGGSIYHGTEGYAGEFGHLTARAGGAECWCGRRGCLELYVGGEGMVSRLGPEGADIADMSKLIARVRGGDRRLRKIVTDGAAVLANGLSSLALIFNPSAIVVGGELAPLGDLLLGAAREQLAGIPFGRPVQLLRSSLGDRASLIGALALVLTESARFADRASSGRGVPESVPSG